MIKKLEDAMASFSDSGFEESQAFMSTLIDLCREDLLITTAVEFEDGTIHHFTEEELPQLMESDCPYNGFQYIGDDNDGIWMVAFTNMDEVEKGGETSTVPCLFMNLIRAAYDDSECKGIVINPWNKKGINLSREALEFLLENGEPLSQDEQDLLDGSEAYQNGDYETAIRLYKKSAEAGNVTALSNLGYCYYYGRNIPVDKEQARTCWEKAAALGDICATYKLGDMYRNGDLPVDLVFSKALYKKAFETAVEYPDEWSYPDACLRILKYCREDYPNDVLKEIAEVAVEGFTSRIEQGDRLSDRLLVEAKGLLKELEALVGEEEE